MSALRDADGGGMTAVILALSGVAAVLVLVVAWYVLETLREL